MTADYWKQRPQFRTRGAGWQACGREARNLGPLHSFSLSLRTDHLTLTLGFL